MSVFSLKYDNEFITPSESGEEVHVCLYDGDTNDFKITETTFGSDNHWSYPAISVGPTAEKYKALQVFGTTIEGDRFDELVDELKAIEAAGFHIFVNRLGLCMMSQSKHPSIRAMRINDYFGWSKYGVKVPLDVISSSTLWNKFDMHNGETMMDVQKIVRSDSDEELRRRLEEKDLKLTACKKELEWSKKMESLFQKLLEAKEKELEMANSQLLAFKAHHEDVE